ncbi:aspartate/tyrosine/aromatic aminotransferase [Pseudoroseomonas deserti]|uniref:aspartate transaminase n=1 Tax=Teichococcus deserti TaxID=1817963 RepID=A0A1V2H8C7_9PROT|nr:aminotransferase [Pseudoroseomonas deserti]ONG58323.1 aspartate/tyrosine/aromatic aminotransferase [Pseudoroseomonas deserti]
MPSLRLSPRVGATSAPPIPAARGWAARYAGQAGPMLDLTQAVPGYPPHPGMLARLAEAAGHRAAAGYGPIDGDLALREAFAADVSGFYGAAVSPAQVAITAGCNLAFTMTMTVLAGSGDAVLLPTPWYFNHRMALELLGIEALPFETRAEDGFVPDAGRLAAAITPNVRAVVLVTPNNPTGAIYPPAVIAAIAETCRQRGIWLVLDETYRDFLPESATPPHPLFSNPDWGDGLVQLYSFAKSYCIPGHRVGAVVGGGAFRTELMKLLDTMQICAARPAQAALVWAVPALAEWRRGNRAIMAGRAEAFRAALAAAPDWQIDALGTYFAYLRIPSDRGDALGVAEALAAERGLLTLPGPFFGPGQDRHLRLAFANAEVEALAALPGRLG